MSVTATSGSACTSRSRATPRPRSCARSWRSRGPGRRSTTSSPTGCPSPSRSRPPDTPTEAHDPPQPGDRRLAVSWLRGVDLGILRFRCTMTHVGVRFGDCELSVERIELRRAGQIVEMEPQVFDVLAYLLHHRERVVP